MYVCCVVSYQVIATQCISVGGIFEHLYTLDDNSECPWNMSWCTLNVVHCFYFESFKI